MTARTLACLLAMLALLMPAVALADEHEEEEEDKYSRPGFYLGANGVFAAHLFEDEVEDSLNIPGLGANVDNGFGFNVHGGYRWLSWLGTDLQYEYIEGFDVKVAGIEIFTLEAHSFTGNVRFIAPLERFEPYLTIGLGATWYNLKDKTGLGLGYNGETAFAGRVGGGLAFYLDENWQLNAGAAVQLTTNDISNPGAQDSISAVHYVSAFAGVRYRF